MFFRRCAGFETPSIVELANVHSIRVVYPCLGRDRGPLLEWARSPRHKEVRQGGLWPLWQPASGEARCTVIAKWNWLGLLASLNAWVRQLES